MAATCRGLRDSARAADRRWSRVAEGAEGAGRSTDDGGGAAPCGSENALIDGCTGIGPEHGIEVGRAPRSSALGGYLFAARRSPIADHLAVDPAKLARRQLVGAPLGETLCLGCGRGRAGACVR